MNWLSWCTVLKLSLISRAFECPEGDGCSSCRRHPEGKYRIDCITSSNAILEVTIRPDNRVTLTCPDSANWTEFYLGAKNPIESVKRLDFHWCNLPEGERLGGIARQLLANDVEIFSFRSYRNLSSILTRNSLRGFDRIKELTLSNNGLSELPEDLLDGLENLIVLNLRENDLRRLPEKFFRVSSLEVVELDTNKIESFASTAFDKLRRVNVLNIRNNKLVKILPYTFDKLVSLKSLEIQGNYLQTLPTDIFAHLANLRVINLSQNNFNADSLPPDLFHNNSNLERVSLSDNKRNMTTLPNGFFASLKKLGIVEMQNSGFVSLPDDLFRGATNLRNLSLERNHLATLPNNIFNETYELSILDLSSNDLTQLPNDVFESLGKLVKLDLSDNRLTSISTMLFAGLVSLEELDLERNNIQSIDIDAFNFLKNLIIGKFSYASLTLRSVPSSSSYVYLPYSPVNACQKFEDDVETLYIRSYRNLSSTSMKETLRVLTHINELTISNSKLSELPEDLLEGLNDLTLLNLENNYLHGLPDKFFGISNLEVIQLGNNRIKSFASTAFEKLRRVHLLNISNNELLDILPRTFDNLESLRKLDIQKNRLETLSSDVFARLGNLEFINLSLNNFTANSLPTDLFRNNSNLENVILNENERNITTLPNGFFADLTKLENLELRGCGFNFLPEDLFRGAMHLKNISLEKNHLSTLPRRIFHYAYELDTLDLSFNDLSYLPDYIFGSLGKLVKLDLSMNHLTIVSEKLFDGLSSLRELNMDRNKIVRIHPDAFVNPKDLRIAKFSYNSLTLRSVLQRSSDAYQLISPFHHCKKLEELYLMYNNISDIFEDWIRSMKLRILNLSHNILSFLKYADLNFLTEDLRVDLTYNNISRIDFPSTPEVWATRRSESRKVMVSIENNPIRCDCGLYDLLRYLEGQLSPSVQNAFHLKLGKLRCEEPKDFRNIVVADLSSKTLKCDADGSEFEQVHCPDECKCSLMPRNKAFLVNCAHKSLERVPWKLECPADYHVELNLTGNLIKKMPKFDQPGYDRVTKLALDHNRISSLPIDGVPLNLEVLQLNNNDLSRMGKDAIAFLKNASALINLTLGANPWFCDCEAHDLLNFVQSKRALIPDLPKVTCIGNDKPISEMMSIDFCPDEIGWIIGACLAVAFLGIIVGSLAALYYRYQREVKVWLYARQWCLWLVKEDELDRDKLYDAFISFSHKDEDFVVNDLVPKLEDGPRPFKLCLHYRDWLAGEWIPKQIARSVNESRRTVVVLSPNFLESVWGRMEFRAAHSQALSEGRARVIVILYGDIGPTDDLDPELKAYLSMNTYVKWGDPWFWEKLKYAMPHPPGFARASMRKKIFETIRPRIRVENEKKSPLRDSTTPTADPVNIFIPYDKSYESQAESLTILNVAA